ALAGVLAAVGVEVPWASRCPRSGRSSPPSELESRVVALAPDRAEERRASAEPRVEAARAELTERASLAAARERLTPSVDLVIAAEALIRQALGRIDAEVDG